ASPALDEIRLREHKSAARVSVTWVDGAESVAFVDSPRGSQGRPLEAEDLISKFLELGEAALGRARVGKIVDLVLHGRSDTPVRELSSLLVPAARQREATAGR
ncbi:MAG: hypothetical protein AB1816_04435, partial [Bacillota bacterium]